MTSPSRPVPSPTAAASRIGSLWKRRARIVIQRGTVAMKMAAGPLGRYCSPQLSAPFPKATSPVPVRTAESHWRRVGQPAFKPPRRATQPKRRAPASM